MMEGPLTLLKRLGAALGNGAWFSGHPELTPLDLDRDFGEIDAQLAREEWPFLRSDLEISHAQPKAVAMVARKDGRFAGFFSCHHFGDVGYLDMMIIHPDFRRAGVARPLYFGTLARMKKRGLTRFVVHTTNDSARLVRLIGFKPGATFTLLARDPASATPLAAVAGAEMRPLSVTDEPELLALDARHFGLSRPEWIGGLLRQPTTRFFGLFRGGALVAAVNLRERRNRALALDGIADDPRDLAALVLRLLEREGAGRRIECFVRDGSSLRSTLESAGFAVPEFFKAIGPLVEWRKGDSGRLGLSPSLETLSWF